MTDVTTLINKYNGIISGLALPTSWTGAPQFIAEVMATIVPQIIADVRNLQNMTGDQKKQVIVDVVTSGLNAAFNQITTHAGISQDQWTSEVENYTNVLLGKMLDSLISANGNNITVEDPITPGFWSNLHCCTKS